MEQPAEEPSAGVEQENGPPGEAAVDNGEPTPAFWRAQGRSRAPGNGSVPAEPATQAGEPEPGYGQVPAEAPAPAVSEAPAGVGAPGPVLAEDVAVIDAEAAVKEPGRAENAREPAETPGGPAATEGLRNPEVTQAPGEPAVTQASPAATQAAAVPALADAPSPAAAASPGSPDSPGGISPQRWSEIMATFVDDPRGSVKMAADAVDSAIEELVASVRTRQRSLASLWQAGDADTERLRTALREYRRFGSQVQQMSPAVPDGQQKATAR
jgi:hypothetical protein